MDGRKFHLDRVKLRETLRGLLKEFFVGGRERRKFGDSSLFRRVLKQILVDTSFYPIAPYSNVIHNIDFHIQVFSEDLPKKIEDIRTWDYKSIVDYLHSVFGLYLVYLSKWKLPKDLEISRRFYNIINKLEEEYENLLSCLHQYYRFFGLPEHGEWERKLHESRERMVSLLTELRGVLMELLPSPPDEEQHHPRNPRK